MLTARVRLAFAPFPELRDAQTPFTCRKLAWAAKPSFTRCFRRIIRAGETLLAAVPALPGFPACLVYSQGKDRDTSASPSALSVVAWPDAEELFPHPSALSQTQTRLLHRQPRSVCRISAAFVPVLSCRGPPALPVLSQSPWAHFKNTSCSGSSCCLLWFCTKGWVRRFASGSRANPHLQPGCTPHPF